MRKLDTARWKRGLLIALLAIPCACSFHGLFAQQPVSEYRGLWVDSWREGFKTEAQVDQLVETASAAGFNLLLPQIRKRGEVYFSSSLEPRAPELSSDFDPLHYLILRARAANPPLEVHPWVVMYPIWNNFRNPPEQATHAFNRFPDWLTLNAAGDKWDGGGYNFDPGHPSVQRHLHDVVMEILRHYEVGGVHLDYIRYRGPEWGYNPVSVERFNRIHGRRGNPRQEDPLWQQFRRDQVTELVRRIYIGALEIRPEARISAATVTWAPGTENMEQWLRSAAFNRVFQDWVLWQEEGILDLNIPMAYFDRARYALAWQRWISFIKEQTHDRHMAIGIGFFSNTIQGSLRQIEEARQPGPQGGTVHGMAGFSARVTNNQNLPAWDLFYALRAGDGHLPGPFRGAAVIPDMPWKKEPSQGHFRVSLSSSPTDDPDGRLFRAIKGEVMRESRANAEGAVLFANLDPGEYQLASDDRPDRSISILIEAGRVNNLLWTDGDEDSLGEKPLPGENR